MTVLKNTNLLPREILHLRQVDSTNNYAMRLIDADKAEHGMAVLADVQTEGKGQRGRAWIGAVAESVLMSVMTQPKHELHEQPMFLMGIAVAVAEVVQLFCSEAEVCIKWPNDIVLKDKKAGGILIENVVRGGLWQWAVVGIGLNVLQESFGAELPNAISLKAASDTDVAVAELAIALRESVLKGNEKREDSLVRYNALLYKRGESQLFRKGATVFAADIVGVDASGRLQLKMPDSSLQHFAHGAVEWIWQGRQGTRSPLEL